MAEPLIVSPVLEVRRQLSSVLARFRAEGATAEPVVLGSHRSPEAVLLSYQHYQALMTEIDGLKKYQKHAQSDAIALASVRAEGQEPSVLSHLLELQVTDGQLSGDEALAALKRHYDHTL